MALAKSWGDTMDDEHVLDALRKLNRAGPIDDTDIIHRADDQ